MKVEVINTGTELLLGNVVNTHLGYFGSRLFPLGLRIERQVTVPDGASIRNALLEAFPRCDILLVTGGLGPTTDDVTREITAELLGQKLLPDSSVLVAIEARLARRGITFQERMRRQIMVPEVAAVLPNGNGTAPGLYLPPVDTPTLKTPHIFLLPGPPRELKPMFEVSVLPLLQKIAGDLPLVDCRVYRVVGIGESEVEARIGLHLSRRPGLEIGYCARPNEVDFRVIGPVVDLDEIDVEVQSALGDYIVTKSGESLELLVVRRLQALGKTIALAESCTGGLLANRLTNVPGASDVFLEGFVTYSNAAKSRSLNIPPELIESHGAVSAPVAEAMARAAVEKTGADFSIAVTGIAGPGGGTEDKPVGTVFMGFAEKDGLVHVRKECYPTDRETFKQVVSQTALDTLRKRLFQSAG